MGTDDVDVEAEAMEEMEDLALAEDPKADADQDGPDQDKTDQVEAEEGAAHAAGDTKMGQDTETTVSTPTAYRLVFSPVHSAKFQRIIMDEAHALWNPNSGYSRMMRVFPGRSTILVTATSTLNKMSDIHGLLNQIHAFSQLNMSDKYFNPGLLDASFNLSDVGYHQARKAPVFNPAATHEDMKVVLEYAKKTGKKPWSIVPALTARIIGDADSANDASDETYKAGIKCVQLRRTMQDPVKILVPLTDEHGVETDVEEQRFPGKNIPANVVRTKELSFEGLTARQEDRELIYQYTNTLSRELNDIANGSKDTLPDRGEGSSTSDVTPHINMAIHRMLLLNAFDAQTYKLFCVEDNVSSFMESAALRETKHKQKSGATAYTRPKSNMASAGKGKTKATQTAKPAVMETEQTELLRSKDPNGSLLYMYYTVDYPKSRMPAPPDRVDLVQWHLSLYPVPL